MSVVFIFSASLNSFAPEPPMLLPESDNYSLSQKNERPSHIELAREESDFQIDLGHLELN